MKDLTDFQKIPKWQIIVPYILQTLVWVPGYLMYKIFTHLKVSGRSNIKDAINVAKKENRPLLYVSNHVHELDPTLHVAGSYPFSRNYPFFWVARKGKMYKTPEFSWRRYIYGDLFFICWGAQPISSGNRDYKKSLSRHIWLLKHGYTVCIFPEGAIDPLKKKVRGGVGYLIDTLNPVVVPIRISGIEGMTSKEFWSRKRFAHIEFLPYVSKNDFISKEESIEDIYIKISEKIIHIINKR